MDSYFGIYYSINCVIDAIVMRSKKLKHGTNTYMIRFISCDSNQYTHRISTDRKKKSHIFYIVGGKKHALQTQSKRKSNETYENNLLLHIISNDNVVLISKYRST